MTSCLRNSLQKPRRPCKKIQVKEKGLLDSVCPSNVPTMTYSLSRRAMLGRGNQPNVTDAEKPLMAFMPGSRKRQVPGRTRAEEETDEDADGVESVAKSRRSAVCCR